MTANPIPTGYQTVTPYLIVEDAESLITFLGAAFDAELKGSLRRPDGSLMHAELKLGDSMVMLGEPMGEFDPMPASIFLYVEDCDAAYAQAVAAGGTSVMEVTTMEHAGVRYGGVQDGSGDIWWIGTQLDNVSWDESQYRIDAVAGQEAGA